MNPTITRRSCVESLVCAAIVAALAAGPAFAAPPAGTPGKGLQNAPGQVAKAPAAAAPAAAPQLAKARESLQGASAKAAKKSGKGETGTSQGASAKAAKKSGKGEPSTSTSAKASGKSSSTMRATGPATPAEPAVPAAAATVTTTPPAASDSSTSSSAPSTSPVRARNLRSTGSSSGSHPSASAAAPPTVESASATIDGGATTLQQLADGALGLSTLGTTAGSAFGGQLLASASGSGTSADLVARGRDGLSTSRPSASANNVEPLDEPRSPITRAFSNVVEVVPAWLWIALGVLGALVLLLAANTFVAAARTRCLERQREKLMEDIGLLQAALLPSVPAQMSGMATTVAYRPADGLAAGGDFYDLFALPGGRTGMLLGDVSGHGREALAKTALVRFTVRAHLEAGMSPREALSIAGRSLDGRLGEDFATVIAAIHDPSEGTLTYASAGHPPPIVIGPSAHSPVTAASAPPVDVGFPTGQRQTVLPMPEGSTLVLYSDGLIEARVLDEEVGPERLAAWLAGLGPNATAKDLVDLVVERTDGVRDDLAAVVLHAAPGATAPAARVEQLKLDVLDADGPDLDSFLLACGVSRSERRLTGRRVSEQLAVTGGVMVEVRAGQHPQVSVAPIGSGESRPSRERARAI